MIEIREAQSRRDLEDVQRRGRKERVKAEELSKQERAEDEAMLRQLLSANDSSYHDKSICIRETRISILGQLATWANEHSMDTNRLFWLYGVAGCGKTAVAASISHELDGTGRLTGSFFCKRDDEERRDPRRLLAHLAYFLAKGHTIFRERLLRSLKDPEFSVQKGDQAYFEFVIKKPLSASKQVILDASLVVVIDALDECSDSEFASRCLAQVCSIASWVKVIVTSRDQPEIRKPLATCPYRMEYSLFDDDARDDIRKLLDKELEPDGRLASISWFIRERKELFVDFSQGLFIWLDTMITFIAEDEGNLDAAEKILGQTAQSEAEGSLDILYRSVIKSAAEKTKTSREVVPLIIGFVVASSSTQPLTPRVIHALLPSSFIVTLEAVDLILARLSAILVRRDDGIVVVHTSVLDFGADRRRCGDEIWLDPVYIQQILARGCLEIMEHGTRNPKRQHAVPSGLRFNICNLETSHLENSDVSDIDERIASNVSSELLYSSLHWVEHMVKYCTAATSIEMDVSLTAKAEISQMLGDFLQTERSLFWLEVLSLTENLGRADGILEDIENYSDSWVCLRVLLYPMRAHHCRRYRCLVHSRNSRPTYVLLSLCAPTPSGIALLTYIYVLRGSRPNRHSGVLGRGSVLALNL